MKLHRNELIVLAVVIGYIAFFTHPPPAHITNLLETPVGHAVILLGILYVTVYQSLIVGIFLGIAYIMTAPRVTEYLDEKEQKPTPPEQPKSSGVPPPPTSGIIGAALKAKPALGETRLPQAQGKAVTTKPMTPVLPKPAMPTPKTKESFGNFASF